MSEARGLLEYLLRPTIGLQTESIYSFLTEAS
jgi:hypothetical protein